MPRNLRNADPEVINQVVNKNEAQDKKESYLEVATGNENKLKEFRRILKVVQVIGKNLKVEEVQSNDPYKVVSEKAKEAYKLNGFNPILVEDTSMDIKGLNGKPGPYVNDFFSDAGIRKEVAGNWLKDKDRSAVARVLLAIFDGITVQIWEGKVEGTISKSPRGTNGFGWDDIFIPVNQTKTFAEMSSAEKDKHSMRVRALEEYIKTPPSLGYKIHKLPEPYKQELQRVQKKKLRDPKALRFAYQLECLEDVNPVSEDFTAEKYNPIQKQENSYFTRFIHKEDSYSLGLMLTDVDRKHLKMYENGDPELWQMGPERRTLALAQRADFFLRNQNKEVHKVLDNLERNREKIPTRSNKRSLTIEAALGIEGYSSVTRAVSLKELGYKKLSSPEEVSRTRSAKTGLFNIIGKYPRSIYAVGCLPFISGWRDVIVTSAIGHMMVFVHRNNLNAIDLQNQIELVKSAKDHIRKLKLGKKAEERALRNIGAALGSNPKEDLRKAKALYEEAGVKLFRIYTINSDNRVIETAKALRSEFGDEIEVFVGQLVDKPQALRLIQPDIRVDGIIYGHGGGRQCTSATNGMALSTLEEVYDILIDRQFNNTSILVEGGIGSYVGGLLVMGIDCILRNGQFANCVIEQGDLYYRHKNGKFCQPYHGSASAPTMIIEAFNKENAETRLFYSGRTKNVEGKSGYIFYQEKANSMTFYIDQFKHYAARTLADLGVADMVGLKKLLEQNNEELLRLVSLDARHTSTAYRG